MHHAFRGLEASNKQQLGGGHHINYSTRMRHGKAEVGRASSNAGKLDDVIITNSDSSSEDTIFVDLSARPQKRLL